MITQGFTLMKHITVFHPFGVALRSKSVPDGFVTKDFTMMCCGLAVTKKINTWINIRLGIRLLAGYYKYKSMACHIARFGLSR